MSDTRWRSPPQLAKRLGIDPGKVLAWIYSGQLRAVNVATNLGGRPRWRIAMGDFEAFLLQRQSPAVAPKPRNRRRKKDGVTEFF